MGAGLMPLVRWINKRRFDEIFKATDQELKEICQEIKDETGEEYAVEQGAYYSRKGIWPFRKTISEPVYKVLFWIGDGEAQCIISTGSNVIGESTKNEALSFLIGVRCGIDAARKAKGGTRWVK